MKITRRSVEALKIPATGAAWLWDSDLTGFGVRARGSARTYVVKYPAPGRPRYSRWITIGAHGAPWRPDPKTGEGRELTTDLAREEALRLLGVLAGGGDPAQTRDNIRGIPTFEAFGNDQYLPDHAEARNKPKSSREDRRRLTQHIYPLIGKERLDHITAGHVTRLHNGLKATPFEANRTLALLSSMFNRAILWRVLPAVHVNPCRGITPFDEPKRRRYLSALERPRIGRALAIFEARGLRSMKLRRKGTSATRHAIAALRVLMLTGARPDEIARLRRDQVGDVVLQTGKTGERALYFGRHVREILDSLPEVRGNPYVFASRRRGQHITPEALSRLWKRVATLAGIKDVRLYDARHTFASVGRGKGLSWPELQALLGHKRAETTLGYAHLDDQPARAANEIVEDEIAASLKR